jgi:hypothetical protein
MRLSDIRGKRSLDVVADAMDLVGSLKGDEHVREFVAAVRESEDDDRYMAFCKLAPVLRDPEIQDRIVSIVARAKGVDEAQFAEDGDILGELWELLTADSEALDFFGSSGTTQPPAGSPSGSTEAQSPR